MLSERAGGNVLIRAASIFAMLFGLLTIWEGGNVLFGYGTDGCAGGQYVPFVVWFNFLAGFAYIVAGAALWLQRQWAAGLAFLIAASTLAVFIGFGLHVAGGGGYEIRTVVAMSLRTLVWFAIVVLANRFQPVPRRSPLL